MSEESNFITTYEYLAQNCKNFEGKDYISEDDCLYFAELEKRKLAEEIRNMLYEGYTREDIISHCDDIIDF